ncbi:MAG TPA: delta-60 repeat domain-containing protein, partial [Flavobacterium sp.]|nr:delta-60 repeat domain-containing protein [Flavobacterium sp.]
MKKSITFLLLIAAFCSFAQNAALDPAFGNAGFSITPNTFEFRRFAFDPTGNIVSMGISKGTGSLDYQLTLTKTDANGIPDTAFGTNGVVLTAIEDAEYPWGMEIQADGKILVSGGVRIDAGSSTYSGFVIRYNTDGSVDTTFAANGVYRDATLNNFEFMVLLSDGSIIAGANENMTDKGILFKLDSNGSLDTSFGINGKLTIDAVWLTNMILLSDGKILC